MREPLYLSDFHHKLGEIAPISEIAEFEDDRESLERLVALGVHHYARAVGPIDDMISSCIGGTIKKAGVDPERISGVVFASSSLDPDFAQQVFVRVATEHGLTSAVPYGIGLAQCANFFVALAVVEGLATIAGDEEMFLVVTADLLPATGMSRIVGNGASVFSDGVASCIVSRKSPRSGYRLVGVTNRVFPDVHATDQAGALLEYIHAYASALKKVAARVCEAVSLDVQSFHKVISGNYSKAVLRNVVALLGLKQEQIFDAHVARWAHCFSADQLLALEELLEGDSPASSKYLLIGNGMYTWGAAVCERVKPAVG